MEMTASSATHDDMNNVTNQSRTLATILVLSAATDGDERLARCVGVPRLSACRARRSGGTRVRKRRSG